MTKPGYPRGDVPVDIFSVLLDTSTPNISLLGPIKDEILSLFRRHKVRVHVEISNDKLCHQPTFFSIALNLPSCQSIRPSHAESCRHPEADTWF